MDLSHRFEVCDPIDAPAAVDSPRRTGGGLLRATDIAVAVIGLVVSAPILMLLVLAIRLDSPGAAVFAQVRLGRNRVPFTLYKFRTMVVDAEASTGQVWATRNDPRITRIGRFLRKSRLDELPQLINVLKGEMSMIGPRPIRKKFADQLAALDPAYDRRFAVRPGLSGYAQIYAPYGSNVDEQLQKIPFDRRYADTPLSLREYVSLLLRTLWHCTVKPAGR